LHIIPSHGDDVVYVPGNPTRFLYRTGSRFVSFEEWWAVMQPLAFPSPPYEVCYLPIKSVQRPTNQLFLSHMNPNHEVEEQYPAAWLGDAATFHYLLQLTTRAYSNSLPRGSE